MKVNITDRKIIVLNEKDRTNGLKAIIINMFEENCEKCPDLVALSCSHSAESGLQLRRGP